MPKLADKLRAYSGRNPFHDSQFRAYDANKSQLEFFPTSFFWSLFNEENEILVGTRGSGKTALLRMLTYSNLKYLQHPEAQQYVAERKFIGFYVPMNLEFMGVLLGQRVSRDSRILFFQFAFNCSAIHAFLAELNEVLWDIFPDKKQKAATEFKLCSYLSSLWFPEMASAPSDIFSMQNSINCCFNSLFGLNDVMHAQNAQLLAQPILSPIKRALAGLGPVIKIDLSRTHWLVCIDEAEFLDEAYLRCINTFMRAAERPLVVKMATLPYRHNTMETNLPGIFVEPQGSDFNYRQIDLEPDSDDFKKLTDHICHSRLARCGITEKEISLEAFLGTVGQQDGLEDYYREEGDYGRDTTNEAIMEGIKEALSPQRRKRMSEVSDDEHLRKSYLNKFGPIYYVRRMKELNSKGNRTPGWFAGSNMVRRISDGNPRRFIQIMNSLVKIAQETELSPKVQHRAIKSFCDDMYLSTEGYPEFGLVLRGLIDVVGNLLAEKVHGKVMMDASCGFKIGSDFLSKDLLVKALNLGIAYCFIKTDEHSFLNSVTQKSQFRLSFLIGVHFWLPLRSGGTEPCLSLKSGILPGINIIPDHTISRKTAEQAVKQLELGFDDDA